MSDARYPGIYRARCTADSGRFLTAYVPQVFGTTSVAISQVAGIRPTIGTWGYVAFEGGDASYPVWLTVADDGTTRSADHLHSQYLEVIRFNFVHDVPERHQFGAALLEPSAPADIALVSAVGTGDAPAREDHVHVLGSQSVTLSALADEILEVLIPTGTILETMRATAATGFIMADGVARSRTTYADLHTICSTQGYPWGSGNGTTTFGIPNRKDCMGVGAGNLYALGATGGAATVTLTTNEMPQHNHGVTDSGHGHTQGSHSHTVNSHSHTVDSHNHGVGGGGGTTYLWDTGGSVIGLKAGSDYSPGVGATTGSASPGTSSESPGTNSQTPTINSNTTGISVNNAGSGNAHNNMPPYVAMNYMIKT